MVQATALKPAVEVKTCSQCPHFKNFNEPNDRGWCTLFDHYARENHEKTNDCVLSSEIPISHELEDNLTFFPNINFDPFPSEEIEDELDKPYSEYEVGCIVKVIDADEDHQEWAVFEIIERKHNKHLYRSTDSYLNEAEWYFRLASSDNATTISSSLWVREDEICFFNQSHNICTNEIF